MLRESLMNILNRPTYIHYIGLLEKYHGVSLNDIINASLSRQSRDDWNCEYVSKFKKDNGVVSKGIIKVGYDFHSVYESKLYKVNYMLNTISTTCAFLDWVYHYNLFCPIIIQ